MIHRQPNPRGRRLPPDAQIRDPAAVASRPRNTDAGYLQHLISGPAAFIAERSSSVTTAGMCMPTASALMSFIVRDDVERTLRPEARPSRRSDYETRLSSG